MNNVNKPVIAISSCILSNPVRYDARVINFAEICSHLERHFELVPVCPEVEMGMSVPRPAVQLTGDPQHPQMTGRDNHTLNITDRMLAFCSEKIPTLNNICGYVFKSKSPSCGLYSTPVFLNNAIVEANSSGLFAKAFLNACPDCPTADEKELSTQQQREYFIERVLKFNS